MATIAAAEKQNLSADDWAQAALDAIATGGLDAAAVEPLARALGVTKGSFYWHFDSRDALIAAALKLWERQTEALIAEAQQTDDAYERIVRLFERTNASHKGGRLYLALAAASDDRVVGDAVRRISSRRLSYLHACYSALGLNPVEAQQWSLFAYATYIGSQQVHRDAPEHFPKGARLADYFKLLVGSLIPRPPASAHPQLVRMPRAQKI